MLIIIVILIIIIVIVKALNLVRKFPIGPFINPLIINNIPDTILVTRIDFVDEINFLTLDKDKITSTFPTIGTENETT